MIPSTFLQGLSPQALPGGASSGKGCGTGKGGFAEILARTANGGSGSDAKEVQVKSSSGGPAGLSRLKKEIMASGRCLEDYAVDENAVAEFGDILVDLGFDVEEVEEMISTLGSRTLVGKVTLADLFKAATQLTVPDEGAGTAAMLDVSALQDLENILGRLGLDHTTSLNILSDALVEGKGIDLGVLAAGIRSVMGESNAKSETDTGDAAEMMERIQRMGLVADGKTSYQKTLDELISEVVRLKDAQSLAEEGSEADGIPGSLLLSYLQQMVAPLGDDGSRLQRLIASAETVDGGVNAATLLSRLELLRQGTAGTETDTPDMGKMSLARFVTLLEDRVAEVEGYRGGGKAIPASRSMTEMAGGLMEKMSATVEGTLEGRTVPVDLEGGKPFRMSWQQDAKQSSKSGNRLSSTKSASDTVAKNGTGEGAAQASKQTTLMEGAQRQGSLNPSGTDSAEKLSEALNAAGREKTNRTSEDSGFGTENLAREMKAGDGTASLGKTTAGRNLPGYLLNQVSRQIIRLRNAGKNEMTLQLKPPHLGRMKLNIEHTAGGIRVGIVVESAAARDMLLANSHDLKTTLADQGLRLDKIDVEAQADFGQSMAQADRGFGQSGGRKSRWTERRQSGVDAVSESPTVAENGASGVDSGRLDLVA